MMYKRFIVFAGEWAYPNPGWEDFNGSYSTMEEAACRVVEVVNELSVRDGDLWEPERWGEWAHVVDIEKGHVWWLCSINNDQVAYFARGRRLPPDAVKEIHLDGENA